MSQQKSDRDHFVEVVDPEFKLPLNAYYPCLSGWNERAVIARQELAAKDVIIAELVALLRMGRELAEASRDIEAFRFSRREKVDRATADVNRILDRYDEAIAKHGGA